MSSKRVTLESGEDFEIASRLWYNLAANRLLHRRSSNICLTRAMVYRSFKSSATSSSWKQPIHYQCFITSDVSTFGDIRLICSSSTSTSRVSYIQYPLSSRRILICCSSCTLIRETNECWEGMIMWPIMARSSKLNLLYPHLIRAAPAIPRLWMTARWEQVELAFSFSPLLVVMTGTKHVYSDQSHFVALVSRHLHCLSPHSLVRRRKEKVVATWLD